MKRNKKAKQAQQRAPFARQEIAEGEMRQMSGGKGGSLPQRRIELGQKKKWGVL